MLRDHRGLSVERRLKAIFWWCYAHSPDPLPAAEILRVMPTDRSIAAIYDRPGERQRLEGTIPQRGGAPSCGRSSTTRSPIAWTGTSRTHILSYKPRCMGWDVTFMRRLQTSYIKKLEIMVRGEYLDSGFLSRSGE